MRRHPSLTLALTLGIAACAGPAPQSDGGLDAIGTPDAVVDHATNDAPTDAAQDVAEDAAHDVPAGTDASWVGSFTTDFRASLEATTTMLALQHVAVTDNLGTMTTMLGTVPAFAAQTVDWTETTGYRLVHVYGTDTENLHVSFVYCRNDRVAAVWHESLVDPLQSEVLTAGMACPVTMEAQALDVSLRPFRNLPSGFAPATGPTIDGTTIQLAADGTGTIDLAGTHWTMHPFGLVNCTVAQCGAPGWYEVHSLLRGAAGETGFVILYLMFDDTTHVRAGWGLRFDVPGALPTTMYTANWQN